MRHSPQARHQAARSVVALFGVALLSAAAPPPPSVPQCFTINATDDSVLR